MIDVISFEEVLNRCGDAKLRALLGNGFSRACRNDIFDYAALFERANFASLSQHARAAFATLRTTDFEVAMRALRNASDLVSLYEPSSSALIQQLRRDSEGLREVLVQAIAGSHPARPHDIAAESYGRCKKFLSNFDDIYTVNYDLLLYWALMQDEIGPSVDCNDGFRTPEDGPEAYVAWDPYHSHSQNVFYLHGALHLFDAGPEIEKYTWVNTGVALVDQIRAALDSGKYPLFVAEGESHQKVERIKHSDFLSRAHKSFANIGGALVVYGHSFAPNDDHILRRLASNKVAQLAVGIYGDPASEENQRIINRASDLAARRPSTHALTLMYFDAGTADVW